MSASEIAQAQSALAQAQAALQKASAAAAPAAPAAAASDGPLQNLTAQTNGRLYTSCAAGSENRNACYDCCTATKNRCQAACPDGDSNYACRQDCSEQGGIHLKDTCDRTCEAKHMY